MKNAASGCVAVVAPRPPRSFAIAPTVLKTAAGTDAVVRLCVAASLASGCQGS